MTNIFIGSGLTILLAMIAYIVSLATQVAKNRNMIIEERTRSISEDRHHKSELDTIKDELKGINEKLDTLITNLMGNGNGKH